MKNNNNYDVLLIRVSIHDGRRLILHYIVIFVFFNDGHLETHPKKLVGPKILSVNILIFNQEAQ